MSKFPLSLKLKFLSVNLVLAPIPEILEGQACETIIGNVCMPKEGAKPVILEPNLVVILAIKHYVK